MSIILKTNKLSKKFISGKSEVNAVKSIDLEVKGEIFGFLGPNGAGKTTTMRMLTTLVKPTAGQATIAGHDLLREPEKVRLVLGYVSQAGGLEKSASARENLILQAQVYGMSYSQAATRAQELIKALDLGSFADRTVETYSGGQRRRADIALGMVHKPQLLFLDEPTTGLDPASRAHLWNEIKQLRDHGTTIFLTTHYLDEADALCDRIAIIDHGTIVALDTPVMLKRQISGDIISIGLDKNIEQNKIQELFRFEPAIKEIERTEEFVKFYVEHGETFLPTLLKTFDAENITISAISLHRPSLDDVFLKKTGRSLNESK